MIAEDLSVIIKAIGCKLNAPQEGVDYLLTDSRWLSHTKGCLFFAIPTRRNTGSNYVEELYDKGVRQFVLANDLGESRKEAVEQLPEVNVWYVNDVVQALQSLATRQRMQYHIPVIGVTGSNGKTIVKDWLVQLLHDKKVTASPKSYNSQIGVPLSVWQLNDATELAVFEAGISETGEMEYLRNVIQPTIGIFTNIGQAHDENFLTRYQKIAEKMQLFTHCRVLIYCRDHKDIHGVVLEKETMRDVQRFTWGRERENQVWLKDIEVMENLTRLRVQYANEEQSISIPFVDKASVENAMHCISVMYYLGYSGAEIAERCRGLLPVAMRLEMSEAVNNCVLINDSYSLDLNSLIIALDFIQHEKQHQKKVLVLSDFVQSGLPAHELYRQVAQLALQYHISTFIGVGRDIYQNQEAFSILPKTFFYHSTNELIQQQDFNEFRDEAILLKGARMFQFENIAKLLQRKSHETVLEVNLDALVSNLNYYRSRIRPSTKLMAMVKASSYGAGTVEIANILQANHVDYLTVAYSDEGVELRKNGITLPIMVMNPEEESYYDMIRYRLEPDIYCFRVLKSFNDTAKLFCGEGERVSVHLEFDTGMHRLGFTDVDIDEIVTFFAQPGCVLSIRSIFSHLACAEDEEKDDFTRMQIDKFQRWSTLLKEALHQPDIMCHICNSSGIIRFNEAQMDMVRLGIGLYGVAPEAEVQPHLRLVSQLKTRVSQIKDIPQGDSVGYSRRWVAERPSRIAIIPIGYADGLSRQLGGGQGRVIIHGQEAPIIGNLCMDMCFVDVTNIACEENDDVYIFNSVSSLQHVAETSHTIVYEVLTSVAPRVRRVYYKE